MQREPSCSRFVLKGYFGMVEDSSGTPVTRVVGTTGDDSIGSGPEGVDHINGHSGSDTIQSGDGNDLAAGDMVGKEWTFVNGQWVYNPEAIVSDGSASIRSYNDVISTGDGDDVLLGNGGHDILSAGAGNDRVNAGTGQDTVDGGAGDDLLNLEDGDDHAQGGLGADTINAGSGNDMVYGDVAGDNLLSSSADTGAWSISQYGLGTAWNLSTENGHLEMSQSVNTQADETYNISFELAANMAGGATSGSVEVLWNGEIVGTVTTTTGVFETHEIEVSGVAVRGL